MRIKTFFYDFSNKGQLEDDVFIRREAHKKVHRLLTFLDSEVGVYFNPRFQMQKTDELHITPPFSPSYKGRPAVYSRRILCQICLIRCLKNNVKRKKLEKITLREKCPNTEFFLVRIFSHLN